MKLDTVRGVASEQGRLYRLAINQTIKTSEAARLCYILREVRCSLESVPPEPVAEQPTAFTIVTVPHDFFVRSTEGLSTSIGPLTLEHMPVEMMAETPAESVSDSESEITDCAQTTAPELDSTMQRARAMGYTPLPPRPRRVY